MSRYRWFLALMTIWAGCMSPPTTGGADSTCGGAGQPCCDARACNTGYACQAGTCNDISGAVAAGDGGSATCDPSSSSVCAPGQVCNLQGHCGNPSYSISNGTVTDQTTGLVWQQATAANPCPQDAVIEGVISAAGECLQPDAAPYCASLSLGGLTSGWRLPTIEELFSLILAGGSPAIDQNVFPATVEGCYWSSSPGMTHGAWVVDFATGAAASYDQGPDLVCFVRCVHSG